MSHSCKEKEMIKFLFLLILSAFVIVYSRQTGDSVRSSITFAVTTVIPALFPFMVLSRMIASSDALQYILSPSEKVTVKLFNISCNGIHKCEWAEKFENQAKTNQNKETSK